MQEITIIIPCFNHGIYIDDAIKSINLESYREVYEVIIIDDGSTDTFTINKMDELKSKGFNVIRQDNKGLAEARNLGIISSRTNYILPLDADNEIVPEIFIEALSILKDNLKIDVVYTDKYYFGDQVGKKMIGDFNIRKILSSNYIDACALIRKSVFYKHGFYDSQMPYMGHEDWELWINFALKGANLFYLNKIGFNYRVRKNSMLNSTSLPGKLENRKYIFNKHLYFIKDLLIEEFHYKSSSRYFIDELFLMFNNSRIRIIRTILFYSFHKKGKGKK